MLFAVKFPFQRCIVVGVSFTIPKLSVGGWGAPRATSAFYSVKLCKLNAFVLFSLITSEIFQLTHRYRYQFVGEVMMDM